MLLLLLLLLLGSSVWGPPQPQTQLLVCFPTTMGQTMMTGGRIRILQKAVVPLVLLVTTTIVPATLLVYQATWLSLQIGANSDGGGTSANIVHTTVALWCHNNNSTTARDAASRTTKRKRQDYSDDSYPFFGDPLPTTDFHTGAAAAGANADKNQHTTTITPTTTTIVSAFYPMNSKHSVAHYSYWMELLFSLQDKMIIFTSSMGYPIVQNAIAKATNNTHTNNRIQVVILELNETNTAQMYNISTWQDQHEKDPEKRIHKTYEVRGPGKKNESN
jgi:hypothetical protein